MLENGRSKIHRTEHIAEPRGQQLFLFEFSAQRKHRKIGRKRECCTVPVDILVIAARRCVQRYGAEFSVSQCEEERSRQVADRITDVSEECGIELVEPTFPVLVLGRVQFPENKWMASHRALPENNQAARQYICAFYSDGDRRCHVSPTDVILRAHHDRLAAVNVHRVVRDLAAHFRTVILENGRRDRWFLTLVYSTGSNGHRSIHNVGMSGDPRKRLADTVELRDRHIKLPANLRVRAGGVNGGLAAAGRDRR